MKNPDLVSITPKNTYIEGDYITKNKTDFADQWHIDHSTLIQPAIYFTDVDESASHMQVILGSHTYPNVSNAGFLYDEYVSKNNLTIGKCFGKRGTVQIHCGNAYHRLKAVQNITRTWIKFEFSSGNNVLLDSQKIGQMLKNDFNLSSFSFVQLLHFHQKSKIFSPLEIIIIIHVPKINTVARNCLYEQSNLRFPVLKNYEAF